MKTTLAAYPSKPIQTETNLGMLPHANPTLYFGHFPLHRVATQRHTGKLTYLSFCLSQKVETKMKEPYFAHTSLWQRYSAYHNTREPDGLAIIA